MRRNLLLTTLTTALLLNSFFSFAQLPQFPFKLSWTPVATYSQSGSQAPVSFVIGNKAYAGSGSFTNEFWEYDPSINTWTRKADIPGDPRLRAIGFSIGNKGYVGTGQTSALAVADFWEYDPATNTWTEKASMPVARRQAVGFSIGSKGYVGTGRTLASLFTADFWEYDPATNTWTQKANFPGAERRSATGFSIGNKGYIGTGATATVTSGVKDFWEYDPATDTWTQKADVAGAGRVQALGFSTSTSGYLGLGTQADIRQYNPQTNSWSSKGSIGSIIEATGFAFDDDNLYTGLGVNNPSFRKLVSSYWEVRNSPGDYDESGSGDCYQYPLKYDDTWAGYIECPDNCYGGFAVKTTQNLGNVCYKSRVDASPNFRGGPGWYGGATLEDARFCRRNFKITFANQPIDPVGFKLLYTKDEIDALISNFNSTFGTSKTYSDLVIVKYSGPSEDLDLSNNSTSNSNYTQITPALTFYGSSNQFVSAEFNVSSYSEFYLGLTRSKQLYVNDNNQSGDAFTTAIGNNSNSGARTAPFATINYAISQAQTGDSIYVDAGLYAEDVVVSKSVIIKGVQAGRNPGTALSRGVESIIVPATDDPVNGTIINILVSDVILDGFTINGDNPSISGSVTLNGIDINKGHGIASFIDNAIAHNNLIIQNNIIRNVQRYGVFMQSTNTLPLSGNLITKNHFDNISVVTGRQGRAVGLANNAYATVSQNVFTKVHTGIWISGGFNAPSQTACSITGNMIESYRSGIFVGGFSGAASHYLMNNNNVTIADLASWNVPGASTENFNSGILINNATSAAGMNISNNTITNTYEGLALGRLSASANWVVNGNTISGSKEIGLYYFNNSATNPLIHLENNTLVDNDTAIYIHYLGAGGAMPVTFSNNTVTGGIVGLHLDGSLVALLGNELIGLSFAGQSGNYIQLTRNALNGQTIDASAVSFESKVASDMSLAELFSVENKIAHRPDYNGVGFIKVKPHHEFVTTSSFNTTLPAGWGVPTNTPDINRAVGAAAEGDVIYIAAGTYANQVTIDKGLTLIGEGQDATSIIPPALPYTAPAGPFTEKGLIQTIQNIGDVHILNLSATGDFSNGLQGILIQSGGSVKNCKVQNGNQGIFFRVESAAKTAVVENNYISAAYIATNFQGSNLTASIMNNTITVSGPDFSSGVFAGVDFGPLPQFSATGNLISGFVHSGFFGGSLNASITQNSFVGTGTAIWQISGNQIQANCNWYGVTSAQDVPNKLNGTITYQPWLTNGTDNDVATGFQPVPGSCNGTPVVATFNTATNISCFGANNGTITVTISGGTTPYTIAWSKDGNPFSTIEDLTNLSTGTYNVIVTDANGSVASINDIVISEPSLLTASASGSNVSCFGGSNGSANVTVDGGTLPYAYLWNNGGTNASISNVVAGIYTVTVTDGNGCTKSASYQVTQPTLLTAVATGTSTACANSATVVASGGTAPYNYTWSNGAITQNITSLPAGTYTVTVTDDKGCQTTASCTVSATEAFNPSASVTNASCFGGTTGSITVTNVNGAGPFQFSLNGVNFSAPSPLPYTFSGLAAGTYTITVKDANGCTGFVEKVITQPTQLVVTPGVVQYTCSGLSTGSIPVTVSGGSPSYTYKWNGPNGYSSTQLNISGLAAGDYSLTVTDSKGCTFVLPVTVFAYPAINITENITNVLCAGTATGSIDLTVTGGTGSGFTYLWNNGPTTQDRSNLAAGSNYKVTITDIGSGCTVQKTYTVTQPSSAVGITVSNPSIIDVSGCNSLGSFTAQGSGGTAFANPDPYRYSINGGNYQASPVFNGLQAGGYTVTVKDANGCIATRTVTIADNGSDEYESAPNNIGNNNNNNRGKAAPISTGATVSARIGTAVDVDYYKLGTANLWTGNYTVTFVQPATAIVFDLVASNGTTIIAPTSSSATYKQYSGLNGTYYVRTSGTNSLSCYQFTVTSGIITRSSGSNAQQEVTKAPMKDGSFDVKVLGNPSANYFNIAVNSSSNEKMKMRVVDVSGRIIEQKENLTSEKVIKIGEKYHSGVYFAEIIQGNDRKTVRLIKL